MRARAAAAAVLLLLAGCGGDDTGQGFPAGSVASPELSEGCESWMGAGVGAIVCDPGSRDGSGLSIRAGDDATRGSGEIGIAQLMTEPLDDGDRIEFALRGASQRAVAAFRAVRDGIPEQVVIAAFDPPASRYTVEVDGPVARVSTDNGRTRAIQIGDPPPQVAIRDGSPREVIETYVALANEGPRGWRLACDLLAEESRAAFESGEFGCESSMGLSQTYDEYGEFPEPEHSAVDSVRLRESDPLIAVVELMHRYTADGDAPSQEKRATAFVPVVEEDGHWRVLLPHTLSPMAALRDDVQPTMLEIRERLDELDELGG